MAKSRDAFRTISEVSDWLETPAHVLRFWESKFTQVKPVKRAGGRRYYRPQDMALLSGIKTLLHDDGMTIKGAQKLLRDKGVKHVAALGAQPDAAGQTTSEVIDLVAENVLEQTAGSDQATQTRIPSIPSEAAAQSRSSLITLLLNTAPDRVRAQTAKLTKLHARLTDVHRRISAT